jgi:hypothetical protein
MTDKEAMKLALFALDIVKIHYTQNRHVNEAITALKERLAQPEPEPVAWGWAIMHSDGTKASVRPRIVDFFGCIQEKEPFTSEDAKRADQEWAGLAPHTIVTLYTTPPQRTEENT